MEKSIDQSDMILVMDDAQLQSLCSEDSSVQVLYRNGELDLDMDLMSLSSVCEQEGPPLEQRDDIRETKRIPETLKEILNFNDDVSLREAEEQMKSRENIDRNMETNIDKIKKMEANEQLTDVQLLEAALVAREKATEVREVAKQGKTTLKRAMEVVEVALPPFLTVCDKSYEKNDLSEEIDIESQQYEQCLAEKKRAAYDFDLGEQKGIEAQQHLNKCIELAKEDEKRIAEKRDMEIGEKRGEAFVEAKKLMDDIIKGELDEVHSCLGSCKSDVQNISRIQEEQNQRFEGATEVHKKHVKTMDMKLSVNKQQQDDLRKQLLKLEEQEKILKERRQFEIQVQNRAKELHESTTVQLKELHKSISNIQTCATTSLKVMELMKDGGSKLLTSAITAEEQYLGHLKDLDVEAKTRWRNAMATSAVECRMAVDIATLNIEQYKETYKAKKEDLNKAVQRQQRLHAEKVKKEMKEYKNEMKDFEKKKTTAEEELTKLMELIVVRDGQLLEMGRSVNSVDELYEWRRQEVHTTDDHPSIDFTESENEETEDEED